jgi:hypothetical protein
VKQIYDKHKEIWWAWANVGQRMTRDDFLRLQNITYLDWKHKRAFGACTNPAFSIQSWVCVHHNDVFCFQDVGEVNGIHVPFNIGIQTPMQLHVMLQFGHNGLIFMDATFRTNDVKYHLFTLMAFDFH